MVGGAGNVALNVASVRGHGYLISVVGQDEDGDTVQRLLNENPNITTKLEIDSQRPTTKKTRFLAAGHQFLRLDRESSEPINPAVEQNICKAFDAALRQADVVIVSDYGKGLLTDTLLSHLVASARAANISVLVDPKRRNFAAYNGATLIKPNLPELRGATGLECVDSASSEQAARMVIQQTGA